ncbi:hypothetical protein NIES4071_27930 [Calothrix sp. NIES-4071]|nr:hypothetical protein NIES4071_27930 [Calothrix sp. NIES-4071]BAZ57115.1 hypothetical protein NIES4105_27870 [Calothrix sp. NIES-4105]
MIPDFDENGSLPPGVHWAEWDEFEQRFSYNSTRRRLINGLKLAMTHLKIAGCRTIYIDGSFTTCKEKPGDFDACYDEDTVNTYNLRINARQLYNHYDRAGQKAKYKGEIFPSNQPVGNYGDSSYDFFQSDRLGNKKGIIAIDLIRWEYD